MDGKAEKIRINMVGVGKKKKTIDERKSQSVSGQWVLIFVCFGIFCVGTVSERER